MTAPAKKRGGARPGAGRPRTGQRGSLTLRLSDGERAAMEAARAAEVRETGEVLSLTAWIRRAALRAAGAPGD